MCDFCTSSLCRSLTSSHVDHNLFAGIQFEFPHTKKKTIKLMLTKSICAECAHKFHSLTALQDVELEKQMVLLDKVIWLGMRARWFVFYCRMIVSNSLQIVDALHFLRAKYKRNWKSRARITFESVWYRSFSEGKKRHLWKLARISMLSFYLFVIVIHSNTELFQKTRFYK